MRFGAHYLNTYVPELDGPTPVALQNLLAQVDELDRLGYDDVWVTEHHFNVYGGNISSPPVFLAAVARTTSQIHLGVAVSVLPLHNPLQVAEAYALVDVISNGRLEFGVARGSTPKEFESFGISYEDSSLRMKEGTAVIARAWSEDAVTFHGELFDYDDVCVLPKPVQQPHPPIWVGASRSDDTFRWAGLNGYHLMTLPYMYETSVLRHWIGVYREASGEAGLDPASREILGKFHIYVASSDSAARAQAMPYLDRYQAIANARNTHRTEGAGRRHSLEQQIELGNVIAGDPQRCIEIIRHWQEALGLTTISGTFHFGGMPQEMAVANVRIFAEQVMPAFERPPLPAATPRDPARSMHGA